MGGYEDLDVYRRAVGLANDLHQMIREWPALDLWSTGRQLMRAADSIGFLFYARASAYETRHWIRQASARGARLPPDAGERVDRIGKMLNRLIDSLTRHQEPGTRRDAPH